MEIKHLESEYLQFIQDKEYGDPIVFTKSGQTSDEQGLERYYYQHGQFQACCVPWGCACPFNILCWTVGFPLALMSWFNKKISEEEALNDATARRCIRYILFPTMIVGLSKNENEEVFQCRIYKFSKYPSIKHEVVENIDECLNDGINGCIQSSMISPMSGIIVFGSETRTVFTGGAKEDLRNYETRPVPEFRMIVPIDEATAFSEVFEETVEKFQNGGEPQSTGISPIDASIIPDIPPPSYNDSIVRYSTLENSVPDMNTDKCSSSNSCSDFFDSD